eukprot:scaffold11325_cov56-Attheya_sp.AAC.11
MGGDAEPGILRLGANDCDCVLCVEGLESAEHVVALTNDTNKVRSARLDLIAFPPSCCSVGVFDPPTIVTICKNLARKGRKHACASRIIPRGSSSRLL